MGTGAALGTDVAVGMGVAVGTDVPVGTGVAVGSSVSVGSGIDVAVGRVAEGTAVVGEGRAPRWVLGLELEPKWARW